MPSASGSEARTCGVADARHARAKELLVLQCQLEEVDGVCNELQVVDSVA